MLNTETLFEYYHLVHLKNGTVLDIPAGRSAFLPVFIHDPAAASKDSTVRLHSPRREPESPEEDNGLGIIRCRPSAPPCVRSLPLGVGLRWH